MKDKVKTAHTLGIKLYKKYILTADERYFLDNRFGLEGNNPQTLSELGKRFGVTVERVEDCVNAGLKKVNNINRDFNITDFTDEKR